MALNGYRVGLADRCPGDQRQPDHQRRHADRPAQQRRSGPTATAAYTVDRWQSHVKGSKQNSIGDLSPERVRTPQP